jgi:protein TonB
VFHTNYLNNPPPEYPPLSRRLGEVGIVTLQVLVSIAGAPEEVQVLRSSGHPRLDRAALEAVKRWKFIPARRGAQAVAALAQVPVAFRQTD